jgi:hypothetical protein
MRKRSPQLQYVQHQVIQFGATLHPMRKGVTRQAFNLAGQFAIAAFKLTDLGLQS